MGDGRGYWDRHARHYDRSMLILGGPLPPMVGLVSEATRGLGKVLEVAAGTGLVTAAIAAGASEVLATDYSTEMVAELQRRVQRAQLTNVKCEQADLNALPYPSSAFDAVVATNVLHLVPNLSQALAELRRVLRRGGTLLAPTYCHDESVPSRLLSRVLAMTGFPGERRFTSGTLRRAVEEAGFRITRAELLRGLLPIGYVEAVLDAT